MAETNFYDVVVCGSELAGLVAAALLGRRGFRVLLLGHDADRAAFEAGPYLLSRAPALLPPLESPPLARVLKELNYVQILRRRAPVMSPAFQIVVPEHRIDVGADAEDLVREVQREWPTDAAIVANALARLQSVAAPLDAVLGSDMTLPPEGFWERREVGRIEGMLPTPGTDVIGPLPPAHPMRAAILAPAALTAGFGPGDLGAVAPARTFELARRGSHRLDGGMAGLRALFVDRIQGFSGELRLRTAPVEVVQRRGRVTGIKVRPRDETIGCEHLLWAGPTAQLLRAVATEKPPRRLRDWAAAMRPACYRYAVSLLVRPEALPEGMGARVYLIADPSRPLMEDNAIAVTVGEPPAREPERVPLWAECLVPAPAVDAGPGYLGALRGRLRDKLSRLLPFFARHLHVLASPYDGLPPELGPLAPASGAPPQPIPAMPMPAVWSSALPRVLDVGAVPHDVGIKNLLLVGRENLPGLGLEGEFVAAWNAAKLITASQPRRDLLRREVLLGED